MFKDKRTGEMRACRVREFDTRDDDPMDRYAGADVMGDVRASLLRKDLRDGCPECLGDVTENGSEPDVLQRWGMR